MVDTEIASLPEFLEKVFSDKVDEFYRMGSQI